MNRMHAALREVLAPGSPLEQRLEDEQRRWVAAQREARIALQQEGLANPADPEAYGRAIATELVEGVTKVVPRIDPGGMEPDPERFGVIGFRQHAVEASSAEEAAVVQDVALWGIAERSEYSVKPDRVYLPLGMRDKTDQDGKPVTVQVKRGRIGRKTVTDEPIKQILVLTQESSSSDPDHAKWVTSVVEVYASDLESSGLEQALAAAAERSAVPAGQARPEGGQGTPIRVGYEDSKAGRLLHFVSELGSEYVPYHGGQAAEKVARNGIFASEPRQVDLTPELIESFGVVAQVERYGRTFGEPDAAKDALDRYSQRLAARVGESVSA